MREPNLIKVLTRQHVSWDSLFMMKNGNNKGDAMNAAKDFSKATIKNLARKGIRVVGSQLLPDGGSPMPWANPSPGYLVDDNGTGRVWTHRQVLEAA